MRHAGETNLSTKYNKPSLIIPLSSDGWVSIAILFSSCDSSIKRALNKGVGF